MQLALVLLLTATNLANLFPGVKVHLSRLRRKRRRGKEKRDCGAKEEESERPRMEKKEKEGCGNVGRNSRSSRTSCWVSTRREKRRGKSGSSCGFFSLFPFIPRRSCSSLFFVPLNTNFLDWKKVHIWIISKKYWDASEYGGIQKRYKGCIYFFGGFVHGKTQKEQGGEGLEGHFLAPSPFFLVCVLSLFQEQHASCKRSQETSLGEEGTRWRRKKGKKGTKKNFSNRPSSSSSSPVVGGSGRRKREIL